MPTSRTVHLRLIYLNPPLGEWDGRPTEFGLQDKQGALQPGQLSPDGPVVFECELQAKPVNNSTVNFLGPYAHGTVAERFLYLSLRFADSGEQGWIRRMKIPLSGIMWEQVENARLLTATLDGRRASRAALVRDWTAL